MQLAKWEQHDADANSKLNVLNKVYTTVQRTKNSLTFYYQKLKT